MTGRSERRCFFQGHNAEKRNLHRKDHRKQPPVLCSDSLRMWHGKRTLKHLKLNPMEILTAMTPTHGCHRYQLPAQLPNDATYLTLTDDLREVMLKPTNGIISYASGRKPKHHSNRPYDTAVFTAAHKFMTRKTVPRAFSGSECINKDMYTCS